MNEEKKKFKVLYRLSTNGTLSGWQELEMWFNNGTWIRFKEIEGPNLLTTLHWRMTEVSRAISPMLSEATTLESLVITEVKESEEPQEDKPQAEANTKVITPPKNKTIIFRNGWGKPVWKIFIIREHSDHYWLNQEFYSKEAAMIARTKIKNGPMGDSFMVFVYSPYGDILTKD